MYRYQGTDDVSNWICFGTTDNCGTNDNLIDKYMYRIIGITSNGELYLLKETFLKEGSTTTFAWNTAWTMDPSKGETYCSGGICPEWNNSLLFKRINGISNGTITGIGGYRIDKYIYSNTDIFVDSEEYNYLKSGDSNSGISSSSKWYDLIANHNWMYGDKNETQYNGNAMYAIETGKTQTTHYAQNSEGSTTVEIQNYNWTQSVKAKISLMYKHDVLYAYPEGNPKSSTNVKNSWIHFQRDGYNSSSSYEWLSTRWGVATLNKLESDATAVTYDGFVDYYHRLYNDYGVRPVFYLISNIKLSGEGTKDNPFVLGI